MVAQFLSYTNGDKKTISNKSYPLKPITEIITNGFFTVDHQWTVKYWNSAAEKLLGVQAKDIVGKNLWDKFEGTIPSNFHTIYHKAFLQDVPLHLEEYWAEKETWFDLITYYSGDTLSVSFKSTKKRPNAPHSKHVKQPKQQLKILNELYQFVTEITNNCLWEWDLQNKELFWVDGGHKKIFGYEIENALIPQKFWETCIHPDDRARVLTKLNKIITERSDYIWEDEYRFQKADGKYAYVHDRGYIIYDGNKAHRIIGATQDITARKLTETQLLESERKLSLIARQTMSAIIITDAEEKISWVNSAFTQMTEYEPQEAVGKKSESFLHCKDTDSMTVQYLKQKIKDKQPFDCEILNYSKSGRKYWMQVQGQPIWNENGNCEGFFAIETDITEKILLKNKIVHERLIRQREITNAVLTAQENERADIGKELHDNLNQILVTAMLYIGLAKNDKEKRKMYLEKSTDYIMDVIEEIRRISKVLVPLAMQHFGLTDNIKNLLDDVILVHPMKIELHQEGFHEEGLDEKLKLNIFRIVQEQLNNILKHAKATLVAIHLNRQENEVMLLISDNGVGCDISTKSKGVGIINIKSRAELYHGIVTITSKPGKGYELKVVLLLNGYI